MLTVLESIKLSTEFLTNKGIESPRINAELMLANILNCKRLDLYLSFERPLNDEETNLYREFIRRRSKFEPLQYILGSVEFYGLEFKVNKSVLIPRPETEILVETILKSVEKDSALNILDIGTGSGIIAISLAKNLPASSITAIDSSDSALVIAKENAELNGVEKQIKFKSSDIITNEVDLGYPFDIVVSNPPYISMEDYKDLAPELRLYEPQIALTDNFDGLNFYRTITGKSKTLLNKGGKLFFELGQGQSKKVSDILQQANFSNIVIKKDYQNIDRVISGELI
jgi:release factor glutamine methyltransferase